MWVDFNQFGTYESGQGSKVLIDYPYSINSLNIWTGYWYDQSESVNMRVYEYNGIYMEIRKGRVSKDLWF